MANTPTPYNALKDPEDQTDEQDPTLTPDKANANNNGSSTPPAPATPAPYKATPDNQPASRPQLALLRAACYDLATIDGDIAR